MTRLRAFTLIELMIVVAILVIVVVVAIPGILETTQTDNQQQAIQALRTYYSMQDQFRSRGVKKVGAPARSVYARPFSELHRYGEETVDLVPEAFAAASDVHHPYHGYYFQDDPRVDSDSETQFGLFAVPVQYPRTGRYVYYVNEDGNLREIDPGEQVADPARYFAGDNHPRAGGGNWERAH